MLYLTGTDVFKNGDLGKQLNRKALVFRTRKDINQAPLAPEFLVLLD
jgi:hypothetical protein